MLVAGVWHQCDDGIIRPVIQAEALAHDNSWWKVPFLLDTGADRTNAQRRRFDSPSLTAY